MPSYRRDYSDFELRIMAEIHQLYERKKVIDLAKILGKMFGGTDG